MESKKEVNKMAENNFAYELTKFETLPPVRIKQFGNIYKCPRCGGRLLEPKKLNQVMKCIFCGELIRS